MIRNLNTLVRGGQTVEHVLSAASTSMSVPIYMHANSIVNLEVGVVSSSGADIRLEINKAGNSTGIYSYVLAGYSGGPASGEAFAWPQGTIAGVNASESVIVSGKLALMGGRMLATVHAARVYVGGHVTVASLFGPTGLSSITDVLVKSTVAGSLQPGSFIRISAC